VLHHESISGDQKDYYYVSGNTIINFLENPTVTFRYEQLMFGYNTFMGQPPTPTFCFAFGVAPILKMDAGASICNEMYMFESGNTQ
jgi:hypothetical protein